MYNHSPLLQALQKHAENSPEKSALILDGKTVTYAKLLSLSRKAASLLEKKGIETGDRIILSAQKDLEFIYIYFGAHILGVTNVIVDPSSNKERICYIEHHVQPAYCFGYDSENVTSCTFDALDLSQEVEYTDDSPANLTSDSIAEILFTTGTTGSPKGVCLSYANIYASADNVNGFVQNRTEDVEILGLPICHSFGLGTIRCNIIKGATVVVLGNFANVRQFFKAIEQYHGTGFRLVPAAWSYIRKISGRRIEKYASQIRYIEIGSAAMQIETKKELLEMFPTTRICMHYGLTEASRNCFIEFHDMDHLDSIGRPVNKNVDIRVFGDKGEVLNDGLIGEICVKGNMVLRNYLEDSDTLVAFYGNYFRTGDTGYMSKEGYLYLMGREKELINVGGKKVSPMEVEDTICALGVGDCVCVGVQDEKGLLGEVVKAFILKDSTNLTFEEIDALLSSRLELYKRPVAYDWIDQIPTTSSGKKQRIKLKENIH